MSDNTIFHCYKDLRTEMKEAKDKINTLARNWQQWSERLLEKPETIHLTKDTTKNFELTYLLGGKAVCRVTNTDLDINQLPELWNQYQTAQKNLEEVEDCIRQEGLGEFLN